MKKLRHKLYSLVMAAALVLQLAPATAFAATPGTGSLLTIESTTINAATPAKSGTSGYDTFVINMPASLPDSSYTCTLNNFDIEKDSLFIVDSATPAPTMSTSYDSAASQYKITVTKGGQTLAINFTSPILPSGADQAACIAKINSRSSIIASTAADTYITPWVSNITVTGAASVTQNHTGPVLSVVAGRYDNPTTAPAYQWYSKASGASQGTAISGATSASYSVPTTATFTNTEFYCVVSSSGKTATSNSVKITVAAPACTYTASVTSLIGPDPGASSLTVDINNLTTGAADVKSTLTVSESGTCNIADHTNHGYSAAWSVTPNDGGVTVASDGKLTIDKSKINAASKEYTITTTASRTVPDGTTPVSASVTLTLTRSDCEKTISGLAQKAGSSPATTIVATDSTPNTYEYPLDVTYSGVCYDSTHTDAANHGLSSIVWKVTNSDDTALESGSGISVAAKSGDTTTGVLSLDKTKLPTSPRSIKITATAGGVSHFWTVTLSRQRTDCTKVVGNLTQKAGSSPATKIETTPSSPTPYEYPLDVTLSGDCFAGHGTDTADGHGHPIAWKVTNSDGSALESGSGISVAAKSGDSSVGVLTLTKDKLPTIPRSVKITASADGKSYSWTVAISRQRTDCTKVVTGINQKPGTKPTLNVTTSGSSGTATFEYAVECTLSGECFAGHTPDTPAGHHRTIAWYVTSEDGKALSSSSGITIAPKSSDSTVGVLSLDRSKISRTAKVLKITATVDGKSHSWTITVKRTGSSGSSGGTNSYDDWDDFEDEIDSAKTGSTISINTGSDTDMPATTLDSIRGINKTLSIRIPGGYTWTVNGKSVKKIPAYQIYIPLGVEEISNSKISKLAKQNDIVILDFDNEGTFYADMKLTSPLGSAYANKTVYLYKYNESTGTLSFKASVKADDSGRATFNFTSASTYVITSKAVNSGDGATVTPPSSSSTWVPPSSSSSSVSSSSSSSSSSSEPESSESESVSSKPTIAEPDSTPESKPEETSKKKIPILVPILLIVIAVVVLAVVLLSRGGFGKRYDD